ncbi:hypothetical protein HYV72_01635, partial [Candidatus Uhrbacteria bacterium]|nr:hypothetical protein [Candidatus Uhrbacteria bacterium]
AKLCETLEGSALESCVRLVAQDTKDVSHCRRLDGDGQTRCEDDVLLLRALADSDKALCERVHDDALRARCAENVTAQIVRAGRCEELHVEKKLCDDEKVIQAAVDRADVTFCETLEEPAQGDCLERVENALNADIDEDGLSRAEEIEAGTDVSRRDTDGDGLSDGEELHVFASNPLRTDTDGDSFEDGEEVENGYSPTGGGRL